MASNVTRDHHRWTRDITSTDGVSIDTTGSLNINSSVKTNFTAAPDVSSRPYIQLLSRNTSVLGAVIGFTQSTGSPAANDKLGRIQFNGMDAGGAETLYAEITGEIHITTAGSECGELKLGVIANATDTIGLSMDGTTGGLVNVDIGAGATSTTTVAGDLKVEGDTLQFTGGDGIVFAEENLYLNPKNSALFLQSNGTTFGTFSIQGSESNLILYEAAGASTDDYFHISVAAAGVTTLSTVDAGGATANLVLDPDGDLIVSGADVKIDSSKKVIFGDAGEYIVGDGTNLDIVSSQDLDITSSRDMGILSGRVILLDAANNINFDSELGIFNFYDDGDTDDAFKITVVGGTGATTLETVSAAADGHLTLDPDGDLIISGADVKIDATKNLYLDGGVDTYISESATDRVDYYVGGDICMRMTEAGNSGNTISFGTSGAGFLQFEPTFDADDTLVFFNVYGNKGHLTMTADIVDVHLYFPDVSCNCQLVVLQDGTGGWDVTNWKTYDQATGNAGNIIWSGGSAPSLTETNDKLDIISIYWDNDNHKAYGVASTNF